MKFTNMEQAEIVLLIANKRTQLRQRSISVVDSHLLTAIKEEDELLRSIVVKLMEMECMKDIEHFIY